MNNKVLVTGSSRGIGRAIGEFFSKNDWDVCFTSRNINDLEEFKHNFAEKENIFYEIDFQNAEGIKKLKNCIETKWGSLDSLVINVGNGSGQKSIYSSYSNNLDIFKLNFYSAYLSTTLLIPLLVKSTNPSLIFIGSIASCENVNSPFNYAMAKRSLENLSNFLSKSLAKNKVRVNCIHLGHVLTENGFWDRKKKHDYDSYQEIISSKTLTNKIVYPSEVAEFIYDLTNSKYSSNLTGNTFIFDGGTTRIK